MEKVSERVRERYWVSRKVYTGIVGILTNNSMG